MVNSGHRVNLSQGDVNSVNTVADRGKEGGWLPGKIDI